MLGTSRLHVEAFLAAVLARMPEKRVQATGAGAHAGTGAGAGAGAAAGAGAGAAAGAGVGSADCAGGGSRPPEGRPVLLDYDVRVVKMLQSNEHVLLCLVAMVQFGGSRVQERGSARGGATPPTAIGIVFVIEWRTGRVFVVRFRTAGQSRRAVGAEE